MIQKQFADFEVRLKNEKDNLKADHIREVEAILAEFEKAKNFLKKEIQTLKNKFITKC